MGKRGKGRKVLKNASQAVKKNIFRLATVMGVTIGTALLVSLIGDASTLFNNLKPASSDQTSVFKNSNSYNEDLLFSLFFVFTVAVALFALIALFISTYQASKRRAALAKIHAEEKRYAEDALELKEIWAVNQQRLDYYHEIAISQSKMSFISTQVATGLGFALIVTVGWIAAQATDPLGTITAGAVGIVGGGLSAFIGATFMKSQSRASAQLQQFFLHPVEYSRLLGAERLIEDLDPPQKAEAVKIIVEAMMRPQTYPPSKGQA